MFGDANYFELLAEKLLDDWEFAQLLEENDLGEVEVLALLLEHGLIDTKGIDDECD